MKKIKLLKSKADFKTLAELIYSKECGYIHNPKTAGTSIWNFLEKAQLLEPKISQHTIYKKKVLAHLPYEYRDNFSKQMYPYNLNFTFCIIREPIERAVSMINHYSKFHNVKDLYSLGEMLDHNKWLMKNKNTPLNYNVKDTWMYPQSKYYEAADYTFLFEDLQHFNNALKVDLEKLNIYSYWGTQFDRDKIIDLEIENFEMDLRLYKDLKEQKISFF